MHTHHPRMLIQATRKPQPQLNIKTLFADASLRDGHARKANSEGAGEAGAAGAARLQSRAV